MVCDAAVLLLLALPLTLEGGPTPMIIPIGHDESAVRRLPWVTWSIMASCLLVFALTDLDAAYESPAHDVYFEQAADYFREHAYLRGHDEVLEHVRFDVPPNQRGQYIPTLRELTGVHAPKTAAGIAAEQNELDRLTNLALGLARPNGNLEASADPFATWGLVPESMTPITLVSHVFMHAGWLHVLGNLLLLFVIGPALEDRWGRPLYAGFYVTAGVFAGVSYASLAGDPTAPLVGASGAVSGVMGAFLVRYWSVDLKSGDFFLAGRVLRGTFSAPAWAMLPLWFANALASAWWADASGLGIGIAYWAHVGGFLFGAAVASALRVAKIEERHSHEKIESEITVTEGNSAFEAALAAREAGDLEEACRLLRAEVERSPSDIDAVLAYWDAAGCAARPEEAASAVAQLIRQLASQGQVELAYQQWLELTNLAPATLVDPGTLMRLLPQLRAQGNAERTTLALRHAVDPANVGLSAGMAMRVIDEVGDNDPPTTLRAAQVALGNENLHETKRSKLEALVADLEASGVATVPVARSLEAERQQPMWDEAGAIEFDEEDLDAALDGEFFAAPNATENEADLREPFAAVPPPLPTAPLPLPEAEAPGPAPTPLPTPIASEPEAVAALVDLPRFPDLKLVDGVPTRLTDDALYLQTPGTRKAKIEFRKVDGIAVAAVEGLDGKESVLIIDLLLNWNDWSEGPLRAVRLRSDTFDVHTLVETESRTSDALREFGLTLAARCGAIALPDREAIEGRPFAVYESLANYEREVLQVDR